MGEAGVCKPKRADLNPREDGSKSLDKQPKCGFFNFRQCLKGGEETRKFDYPSSRCSSSDSSSGSSTGASLPPPLPPTGNGGIRLLADRVPLKSQTASRRTCVEGSWWAQTQPARRKRADFPCLPLKSILRSREIILSDIENSLKYHTTKPIQSFIDPNSLLELDLATF